MPAVGRLWPSDDDDDEELTSSLCKPDSSILSKKVFRQLRVKLRTKIIMRYVAFSHLYKSQELGTPTFAACLPFCFPVASWMLGLPGSPQGSPHPHLRILSKAQQSRELSAFAEETSSTTRCGKCPINLPKNYNDNPRKCPNFTASIFRNLLKNLLLRIQCCQF